MSVFQLVRLDRIMAMTRGNPRIKIGLIDGLVAMNHPGLSGARILSQTANAGCQQPNSIACQHGTFIAGILVSANNSESPGQSGICPDCTIFVSSVFSETVSPTQMMPLTTPTEIAQAILKCLAEKVKVINLSAGMAIPSSRSEPVLERALNEAARQGVLIVVAAGNQHALGSSSLTRHPWVIPVVACDAKGFPTSHSNLGRTIGNQGLCAPGESIQGLNSAGGFLQNSGTSVAAPFVTGAIALLWSLFPDASAIRIKTAVLNRASRSSRAIVPPLLDAWGSYQFLQKN